MMFVLTTIHPDLISTHFSWNAALEMDLVDRGEILKILNDYRDAQCKAWRNTK